MQQFIVYRLGYSPTNQTPEQGLPEKMAVMRVEAENAETACRIAATQITLSDGQRLTAEPAAPADAREDNRNLRVEALPRESNELGGCS